MGYFEVAIGEYTEISSLLKILLLMLTGRQKMQFVLEEHKTVPFGVLLSEMGPLMVLILPDRRMLSSIRVIFTIFLLALSLTRKMRMVLS